MNETIPGTKGKPGPDLEECAKLVEDIEKMSESDTQHTPGPWAWFVEDYSMAKLVNEDDPIGKEVLTISPCSSCQDRAKATGGEWAWGVCSAPTQTDAKLIAAAPDLLEALKAITPPKALGIDWWCPECKEVMSGKNVTNAERCESCGTYIGDCQPSDEWHKKALAAIAKATGGRS